MAGILLSQKRNGIIFWCMALASLQIAIAGRGVEERSTMRCDRRYYRLHAVKSDDEGRKCWGTIAIKSCRGRCESNEISDWRFPYKQSRHPVCVHGERIESETRLKYCDPGVAPDFNVYRYVEAENCKCQICSSEDTSCEWLPNNMNELQDLFLQSNQVSSDQLEDDD